MRMRYYVILAAGLGAFFLLSPTGSLLLPCAVVVAVLAFFRFRAAVYAAMVSLPVYSLGLQMRLWTKVLVPVYYLFIVGVVLIWAIRKSAGLEASKPPAAETVFYREITTITFFFVFWSALSLHWSLNFSQGSLIFFELLAGVMIFLLTPEIFRSRDDIRRLIVFLTCLGVLLAATTVISQWYHGEKIVPVLSWVRLVMVLWNEKGRAGGFTGVNYAAMVLASLVFAGITVFLHTRGVKRLLSFAAIFFMMVAVIMTGSKSGFGGMLFGLFFVATVLPVLKTRRTLFSVGVFTMIILSFLIGTYITTGNIGTARVTAVGASFSFKTRLEWWGHALAEWVKYSGIGFGTGGLRKIMDPILFAHNMYLSTLFDEGVIGFIIFSVLLLYIFAGTAKAARTCKDAITITALYCMTGSTLSYCMACLLQADYYTRLFWWLAGIHIAVINVAQIGDSDQLKSANFSAGRAIPDH